MSAFADLYRKRGTISDKYLAVLDESQSRHEQEYNAAAFIQGVWRQSQKRKERTHRNQMAIVIQKTFRRHQARTLLRCLRVEKARAERIAYFNIMATRIQKLWRGYKSRRTIFDFRKKDGPHFENIPPQAPGIADVPSIFQPPALISDRRVVLEVQKFLKTIGVPET